jgi:hypothetical protein
MGTSGSAAFQRVRQSFSRGEIYWLLPAPPLLCGLHVRTRDTFPADGLESATSGVQLQVLRELQRDSRTLPQPSLNEVLIRSQDVDPLGGCRQIATNHIHEYLNLPGPEPTAIQAPADHFFDQAIKLGQDRIVVKFQHFVLPLTSPPISLSNVAGISVSAGASLGADHAAEAGESLARPAADGLGRYRRRTQGVATHDPEAERKGRLPGTRAGVTDIRCGGDPAQSVRERNGGYLRRRGKVVPTFEDGQRRTLALVAAVSASLAMPNSIETSSRVEA